MKVAFGDDQGNDEHDENQNHREILEEKTPVLTNQTIDKKNGDADSDKIYERGLFTIHNTTVEVILEKDILSWATVTGESML